MIGWLVRSMQKQTSEHAAAEAESHTLPRSLTLQQTGV